MKVYIQVGNDREFININTSNAFHGFSTMGWEIEKFHFQSPAGLMRDDIVVGYISTVKNALRNLGINPPSEIDYPEELSPYYGRKIWEDKLHNIANDPTTWPIFIKPKNGKQFDGRLVSSLKDLIGCASGSFPNEIINIWCAEPIEIISEWRCFIYYDKVMDVRPYKGSWRNHFDPQILDFVLDTLKDKPAAFTIDIGVTKEGKTIVVEINDGYSVGCYGLQSNMYAKFISARWCEMARVPDFCKF
jgi:hypothetical protein